MTNLFKVGDIVKINQSFLGEPIGVRGYVYGEYTTSRSTVGVSIITENGVDLGGFSSGGGPYEASFNEQKKFLTFVKESDFCYKFTNVIQLDRDFEKIIKPLFEK